MHDKEHMNNILFVLGDMISSTSWFVRACMVGWRRQGPVPTSVFLKEILEVA
jgi:hypothetical protein